MNNKKAFTLVELLVVIGLIAILTTIGFTYTYNHLIAVRDSIRIVEFENIESSMNKYSIQKGVYPKIINGNKITYSGGLVWTQGTFDNNIANFIGYSEDIVDPLTDNLYTYSVKNNRKSFSIAGILEKRVKIQNEDFAQYKNGENNGGVTAFVKGNYNGEIIAVSTGGINQVLAISSIISTNINNSDLVNILTNNELVYNSFNNLPSSYSGSEYILENNIDFSPNNLVVFSGSFNNLKNIDNQVNFLQNTYNAYSGSILGKQISVNKIDRTNLFNTPTSNEIRLLACDLIKYKLKYSVDCD